MQKKKKKRLNKAEKNMLKHEITKYVNFTISVNNGENIGTMTMKFGI